MPRFAVILPAAGRSTRFAGATGGGKKPFADLDGRAVWLRAADAFWERPDVAQVVVAVAAEDRELFDRRYGAEVAFRSVAVVDGGAERFDTIAAALAVVDPACDFVAVHDAARPCVPPEVIAATFAAAVATGAAIPAVAVADTLKRVDADGRIEATVPRAGLVGAQTPQTFRRDWLQAAYDARGRLGETITDDAQLVAALGHPIAVVAGSPLNLKVTTAADLDLAAAILRARPRREAGFLHPFSDERASTDPGPKRRLDDLF